ncbi:MAG: hypothetical protein GAK31_00019 [Stenotrophomonas maltophilia]|uniref:Uncharacterized protein n=1 Tax=Stenotrophomonas maltophilia TaxID=40324 RepID=A0A7V8FIP1_STEMA|nr:MAG: hypothetical protein GAK31_00019 [Stenotrophomonas maltophilia]
MSQFAGWLAQRYKNSRSISDYENIADVNLFDSSAYTPIDQGVIAIGDDFIE